MRLIAGAGGADIGVHETQVWAIMDANQAGRQFALRSS